MSPVDDGHSRQETWGSRLKKWREWDKNWTQEDLKENIEATARRLRLPRGDRIDTTLIRRWERGSTRTPQAHYRRILGELGAPLPSACLTSDDVLDVPPTDDSTDPLIAAAQIVRNVTQRDLSVNRRDLGKLFVQMLTGSALLESVDQLLAKPTEHPPNKRGSIGYDEVARIENSARLFRDWDDQFGGGLRRKAVVGQLNEVSELLTEPQPAGISIRLHRAMAELAETSAMMSWDAGHGGLAQRYYIMALHAAKAAGDTPFAANVLAGMARQSLYLGDASDALDLIRLAQEISSDQASASVRSMLYVREAWAYSALGRITAFERATGHAEDTYADANPDDDPHWISYFDLAELDGTIGGRLLELAGHDVRHAGPAADRIARAITNRRQGRLRSSALDHLGLAESFVLQGELEEASRHGHNALDVATQTASDRVRVQLLGLETLLAPHLRTPAIKGLHDRMRSIYA